MQFAEGHKLYIKGLLEMDADGKHYPDANFTIRLTYGNVKSYSPPRMPWITTTSPR